MPDQIPAWEGKQTWSSAPSQGASDNWQLLGQKPQLSPNVSPLIQPRSCGVVHIQEHTGSTNWAWSVKRRKKRTQARQAGREVDLEGTEQGIKHDQNVLYETQLKKKKNPPHFSVVSKQYYIFSYECFKVCLTETIFKIFIWVPMRII